MDTLALKNKLKKINSRFQLPYDVVPRDKLIIKEGMYIVNCCPSKYRGIHWISIFVKNNRILFFDSLGRNPSYYNLNIPNVTIVNKRMLQSTDSDTCGQFALFFLYHINILSIAKFLRLFVHSTRRNDALVIRFADKL